MVHALSIWLLVAGFFGADLFNASGSRGRAISDGRGVSSRTSLFSFNWRMDRLRQRPASRYDRVRASSGAPPPSSAEPLVSYATSDSPRSQGAAQPSFSGAALL